MHVLNEDNVEQFVALAKQNLITLEANLTALGYEFANPFGAVQLAEESDVEALRALASECELPLLFRRWYELFRCVDFSQTRSQMQSNSGNRLAGLGLNCPLVFRDVGTCLRLRMELRERGINIIQGDGRRLLPIGGAASNCEPKGIWIPDSAIDPVIYDEGAGPITMSAEIVGAIEAGGFPFWERMLRRRRFTSPLGFTPDYKGIVPALMNGITLGFR